MIFIKYGNKNKYRYLNINFFKKEELIYFIKLKENLEKTIIVNNNSLYPNKLGMYLNQIFNQRYKYPIIILKPVIKLYHQLNHRYKF
jgi:hypothetical protein